MKSVAEIKYYDATTAKEASEVLAANEGKAKVYAGGTDMLDWLKRRYMATPEVVVNIKNIPGMKDISEEGGGLKIGACVTLTDLRNNGTVQSKYKMLADAVRLGPAPPIQNLATVAGDVCQEVRCWYYRMGDFYCYRKGGPVCFAPAGRNIFHAIMEQKVCSAVVAGDLAPALAALNAKLKIEGVGGSREVEMKDFYVVLGNVLKPDEIITSIIIPEAPSKGSFQKSRIRHAIDFAMVSVAAATTSKGTTVALGGVAPILVVGTPSEVNAAIDGASPLSENKYKVGVAKALVAKATA